MTKVWRFRFGPDGEVDADFTSFHETEEAAYRGAIDFLIKDMLNALDFGDADHQDALRQTIAHAEAGDFEAAFDAYVAVSERLGWSEHVSVEAIPLVAGSSIEVLNTVRDARKVLSKAEAAQAEDESEAS